MKRILFLLAFCSSVAVGQTYPFRASIVPGTTNTYDVGSMSLYWDSAFVNYYKGTTFNGFTLRQGASLSDTTKFILTSDSGRVAYRDKSNTWTVYQAFPDSITLGGSGGGQEGILKLFDDVGHYVRFRKPDDGNDYTLQVPDVAAGTHTLGLTDADQDYTDMGDVTMDALTATSASTGSITATGTGTFGGYVSADTVLNPTSFLTLNDTVAVTGWLSAVGEFRVGELSGDTYNGNVNLSPTSDQFPGIQMRNGTTVKAQWVTNASTGSYTIDRLANFTIRDAINGGNSDFIVASGGGNTTIRGTLTVQSTGASSVGGSLTATGAIKTDSSLTINERSTTPSLPTSNTQIKQYVKGDKLIWWFNAGGTAHYFYIDLTATANQQVLYSATEP